MRTTKAEVEGVFKLWVASIGGRIATSYNDQGAYRLDHASCYGGWQIERIDNERGGVSVVFGRLTAYYFVAALRMGMRTLEQSRLTQGASTTTTTTKIKCDNCPAQPMTFVGTIGQGEIEWYQCEKCGVDMTRKTQEVA